MRFLPQALGKVVLALAFFSGSAQALRMAPQSPEALDDWEALLQYDLEGEEGPVASHSDTVWFGGSGSGNGSVVRGGVWDWEASSGETPLTFPDGDPIGNQFRDGWFFEDRTSRNGPSQTGTGHWSPTGVYNFNLDRQAYTHRATTHPNNGVNDGPGPLVGSWSIWVGTNLFLNPENCGWGQTRGYGDGWSAGIQKSFAVPAGSQGVAYTIDFFHRYAVEDGFDTNFVEISYDGLDWFFVDNSNIFNGGDASNPLPAPGGGAATGVNLGTIPFNTAGTLHVRFRLIADAFFSDNNEQGNFLYAWQLDSIQLRRGGTPEGALSTFEAGLDGWELRQFEGKDVAITGSLTIPAGRIVPLADLSCPPVLDCPAGCGLVNNILMFADKDICDLQDSFQDSYATSPAFAIGGPTNPDLDGDSGRLLQWNFYRDGGATGDFETGGAVCYVHWPLNAEHCPYTPPGGDPGAGTTFNWSQTDFAACDFFFQTVPGPLCQERLNDNISSVVPGAADSVILHFGAFSQCRSEETTCDTADNGAPFYDSVRFGVFNPQGASSAAGRYCDSFPTTDGSLNTVIARSDGSHSFPANLGNENPLRHVRADTVEVIAGAPNLAVYLRWRVDLGPCPGSMSGHPFFAAFPAGVWHASRMDTARGQGTGINSPGNYMTCFHESDPRNGTFWDGPPPAVEPCDDILPDGAFKAGARIDYFFELRNATNNAVLGTNPAARNGQPIRTTDTYKNFWLEWEVLPKPVGPACDGSTYENNLLVVNRAPLFGGGFDTHAVRLRAVLESLGLEFDIYDQFGGQFNGIGRRDAPGQAPRPPIGGATGAQLEPYDCIWWYSRTLKGFVMSDREASMALGGEPSQDMQTLETWIAGCTPGNNRLLVLDGFGWASYASGNMGAGPTFLINRAVGVLADDYANDLANADRRRCARITGRDTGPGPRFNDGEIIFSGCPEDVQVDVLSAGVGAEVIANFVESHEGEFSAVNCADDTNEPTWHAVVRNADANNSCERSLALSFGFTYLYPLNCVNECLFDDFRINAEGAEFVIDQFQWAGKAIAGAPIGVEDPAAAPRLVNALYQAEPNPANPSARIRYSIKEKGPVTLRIFDVGGRLVRTLVEEVKEPAAEGYEVVWDGTNDAGQRVGSGVFFYQIEAPNFTSAKKLVILK